MITPRNVTQAVAQGSVLSHLLFNITLCSLPGSFLQPADITVSFARYNDDLTLWCVGPSSRGSAVPTPL